MTGIFDSPKWDIDAFSETLNTKVFGLNSRKLSKLKEKRKKKVALSQASPAFPSQKQNKKVRQNVQEKFRASKKSPGNVNDSTKHIGCATKKVELQIHKKNDGTNELGGKKKKKKQKKHKGGSSLSRNQKETLKNQLQVSVNTVQTDGPTSKKKIKQNSSALQNKELVYKASLDQVPQETKYLKPFKRLLSAFAAEAESEGSPAKKQKTENLEVCNSRSEIRKCRKLKRRSASCMGSVTIPDSILNAKDKENSQDKLKGRMKKHYNPDSNLVEEVINSICGGTKQFKNKSQKTEEFRERGIEAYRAELSIKDGLSSSYQKSKKRKVKDIILQEHTSKGVVNEAFSAESSLQDESFSRNQVTKKTKPHKNLRKKVSKGIVNEAFSAHSSVQDESFSRHQEAPKTLKAKDYQQKDIYKGIINQAFSDDSNFKDESFSRNHKVPKNSKAKRHQQNRNSEGNDNEVFSAEFSIHHESVAHNRQAKKQKIKDHQQKGIINQAFSDEPSFQEESYSAKHQMEKNSKEVKVQRQKKKNKGIVNEGFSADSDESPRGDGQEQRTKGIVNEVFQDDPSVPDVRSDAVEQVGAPPWHISDQLEAGQRLSRKMLAGTPLRERMIARLKASRFRYLNEQIYSSDSSKIQDYFSTDRNSFLAYHEGFRQQVSQWPLNPLDTIINSLKKKPQDLVIADFGCGDARLARSLPNVVHSFDVAALCQEVMVCDMAHTGLPKSSVDVAVFCLSLMGTNLTDYLLEANRVLKVGGLLKIAEVESRFKDVNAFISGLKKFGFTNSRVDLSHDMFYFLDFKKASKPAKKTSLPPVTLKPCLYKKR